MAAPATPNRRSSRARRWIRMAALAAATAVLAGLQTLPSSARPLHASTSPAGPLPTVGVNFHAMRAYQDDDQRDAVILKLAQAGVKWVRIDLTWCSLQENDGADISQWYLDLADRVVNDVRAHGMQVLFVVWCTPGWANGRAGQSWSTAAPIPPTNASDYAAAMSFLASHFKGRVGAYEIWNEPNLPWFFASTPAAFVTLLKAAYPAVKSADPTATVVMGGVATNDAAWISAAYAAGAHGSFDVLATHPYMGPANAGPRTDTGERWTIRSVAAIHSLMVLHSDGAKPIWFTEYGWSSHRWTSSDPNWTWGVTEDQQAYYMVNTMGLLRMDYPYVKQVFWYEASNEWSGNLHEDNFGLLYRDLSPKPAYWMLKNFLTTGVKSLTPSP